MDHHDLTDAWMRVDVAQERARAWWCGSKGRRLNIMLVSLVVLALFFYMSFLSAPASFPDNDIVTIERGDSLNMVSENLKREHIVRSGVLLKAFVVLLRGQGNVFAGDYLFDRPESVITVARRITTGEFGLDPARISIPEGASVREMAVILDRRLPRFNPQIFIKNAVPLEGYLFPDTYFFLPNTTEEAVIETMLDNFKNKFAEIEEEFIAFGRPIEEVVVMASLLEKESHDFEDKQGIAGVLWERLRIGMPLQVDATFLYINGKSTFELTLDDLQGNESPYNTYKFKGLPPGPIASPGLDSLLAAVTPKEHDYLFYLADNNNVTYFSETYAEHLRKKRLYIGR